MKYKVNTLNKTISQTLVSLKESWRIILLLSLFICGLIIGSFVVKNNDSIMSNQLESIIKSGITTKNNSQFWEVFFNSITVNLVFLISAFSLGLCAIGIPFISLIPLIKGFGLGISGAYIYSNYSVKGVCYCLLILFPAQIISSALLIYACNESYYMSGDLFFSLNNSLNLKEKNPVRLYLTRFLLLALFIALSAGFDAVLSSLFSSFFSLF